jgi:OmcA/MtrC family decaheme c-type cytochrome
MRIPPLGRTKGKLIAMFAVVAISILTAGSVKHDFAIRKAASAPSSIIDFVRPGLVLKVLSATIGADGTMAAHVSITDPEGLQLDPAGVATPGAVTVACTVAVLPSGSNDFVSYTPSPASSSTSGNTTTEVWFDESGTLTPVGDGTYTYTLGVKAPSGFDPTATHRVGCTSSRNLTSFGLSTYYSASTLDFVPSGAPALNVAIHMSSPTGPLFAEGGASGSAMTGAWASPGEVFYLTDFATGNTLATLTLQSSGTPPPPLGNMIFTASPNPMPAGANVVTVTWSVSGPTKFHDIVRTAACDSCHLDLNYHGGQAIGADLCVLCHTKVAADPTSGNSLYFPVLIHSLHMGENLPSVKAGTPYQFYGYGGAVSDFSTVAYPSDPGQCSTCHDAKYGATQAGYFQSQANRAACGACHDDVNFATGLNHVNLVETDDSQCTECHILKGELPLDASILGAHINPSALIPDQQSFVPGMVFSNLQVTNGTAGNAPTITFTMQDKSGNAIALSELVKSPGHIAAVLAGPASDYGYTSFGADQTTHGYISETVTNGGSCDSGGNCTYTFTHAIPANAKGTYSIGLEGRRALTILPGTVQQVSTEYGAHNLVSYFSVDGSAVVPRRTVVSLDNCNACHTYLSLHGANRDRIEMCVTCHNPSETDVSTRASATNATDKATPPQSVDFGYMIHHIHGGADVKAYTGATYIVVGYGGSHNDFSNTLYPVMHSDGTAGNIGYCEKCHVNGSEQNLPEGLNAMVDPQSTVNPMPRVTADCTACHADAATLVHAQSNTTTLGESCTVCHGPSGAYSVATVHESSLPPAGTLLPTAIVHNGNATPTVVGGTAKPVKSE